MEAFLEGEELSLDRLRAAARSAVIALKIVPVFCGSAFKNKGVQPLLDAVCAYLPSPLDLPDVSGLSADDKETPLTRKRVADDDLAALAFKVAVDPFVGQLVFTRIYSGVLKSGSAVYNSRTGKQERISKILRMSSNSREELQEASAGDIVALVGLKEFVTGDTVCEKKTAIRLESVVFPEPVISVAIEPKSQGDAAKLLKSLDRLEKEDPTFRVKLSEDTGQTLISGMGELHLDIIVDRLMREFRVNANVGSPQVSYRESIDSNASGDFTFQRETEKLNQFAQVKLKVEPCDRDEVFEFENKASEIQVPEKFIAGVKKGIEEALAAGPLAGFSMMGVKVTLLAGAFVEETSDEISFKIATASCLRETLRKASPILLEPVMQLEVIAPEDYLSAVISDLNSRNSQVSNVSVKGALQVVEAIAPLEQMFGYTTKLRSVTQGRASFSMQFSNYQQVSGQVLNRITGGYSY